MLTSIQILRAMAAYAVVLYHCLIRSIHPEDPLGKGYFDLLSSGVDLFFIISGFIMVHTTRDDETPASFAIKRVSRIVPLYWAATAVVIALVIVRPWTFYGTALSADAVLASLFFVPHLNNNGEVFPILGVGWTLNFEMMFYALFTLSLFLPRNRRLAGILVLIAGVWIAAVASGKGVIAEFYANPILFEFAAGCLLAHAARTPAAEAFAKGAPMWAMALAGVAALVISPALLPLSLPSILRVGAPLLLIVAAAVLQDMYRRPSSPSLLSRLGDASYSAYLLHPIVIVFIALVLAASPGPGAGKEIVLTVSTFVATAIISLLSGRWFERPVATILRKTLTPPKAVKAPT
jgi:exopolysaccharide production protein ExoZ